MFRKRPALSPPAVSILATALLAGTLLCSIVSGEVNNTNQESSLENSSDELVVNIGFLRNRLGKPTSTKPVFFYKGTITPLSEFSSKLQQVRRNLEAAGQQPNKLTVVIRADTAVSTSVVQNVIRACQKVGFEKFSLKPTSVDNAIRDPEAVERHVCLSSVHPARRI